MSVRIGYDVINRRYFECILACTFLINSTSFSHCISVERLILCWKIRRYHAVSNWMLTSEYWKENITFRSWWWLVFQFKPPFSANKTLLAFLHCHYSQVRCSTELYFLIPSVHITRAKNRQATNVYVSTTIPSYTIGEALTQLFATTVTVWKGFPRGCFHDLYNPNLFTSSVWPTYSHNTKHLSSPYSPLLHIRHI